MQSFDHSLNEPFFKILLAFRCHYPGTLTTTAAIETGKPLWASEDYSTFNDLSGGGCWARVGYQGKGR
ncbi:hypothetical protein DPMN_166765 [Dreissena polymorpha]|uniref:Glycosyl hydrolase family 59 catalytic domain-containing protein n=1 Tax=Dreissena polymorpha TaxID=45954 RepID=A0A9D4EXH6_DREPO|nr:hypothetical protein DPMN_166765 [Dreissena polymorpha]